MSLKWIPNALTLARCALAFVVGGLILGIGREAPAHWLAFAMFVFVALTDFVDGYAARKLDAVSAFGAFMDPIGDKLLVAASLLALSANAGWSLWLVVPSAAIIARDLFVTLIRLRPNVSLPVTRLAKWKTAFEMLGIGGYLLGAALPHAGLLHVALGLILLAAAMSVYTGALYLRSMMKG